MSLTLPASQIAINATDSKLVLLAPFRLRDHESYRTVHSCGSGSFARPSSWRSMRLQCSVAAVRFATTRNRSRIDHRHLLINTIPLQLPLNTNLSHLAAPSRSPDSLPVASGRIDRSRSSTNSDNATRACPITCSGVSWIKRAHACSWRGPFTASCDPSSTSPCERTGTASSCRSCNGQSGTTESWHRTTVDAGDHWRTERPHSSVRRLPERSRASVGG